MGFRGGGGGRPLVELDVDGADTAELSVFM